MSNSAKHEAMNSGQAEEGLFSTVSCSLSRGLSRPEPMRCIDVARGVKHLGRRGGNGGGQNLARRHVAGGLHFSISAVRLSASTDLAVTCS